MLGIALGLKTSGFCGFMLGLALRIDYTKCTILAITSSMKEIYLPYMREIATTRAPSTSGQARSSTCI
jgi:hypothetical protein